MSDLSTSWSNTQYELFVTCPRKYYYKYVKDYDSLDPAGTSALFSKLVVHPMVTDMYAGEPWNDNKVQDRYSQFIMQAGEIVGLDARYSLTVVNTIQHKYSKQVERDTVQYTVKMVEARFTVAVGNASVIVIPDVILHDGNQMIPLDIKVSQYNQPKHRLPYYNQFVGQCVALESNMYICDQIQISKGGKVKIEREHVYVDDELKEEWMKEQGVWISARDKMLSSNVWPKNSHNCYQYNKPCPFIRACEQGRTYGEEVL